MHIFMCLRSGITVKCILCISSRFECFDKTFFGGQGQGVFLDSICASLLGTKSVVPRQFSSSHLFQLSEGCGMVRGLMLAVKGRFDI